MRYLRNVSGHHLKPVKKCRGGSHPDEVDTHSHAEIQAEDIPAMRTGNELVMDIDFKGKVRWHAITILDTSKKDLHNFEADTTISIYTPLPRVDITIV